MKDNKLKLISMLTALSITAGGIKLGTQNKLNAFENENSYFTKMYLDFINNGEEDTIDSNSNNSDNENNNSDFVVTDSFSAGDRIVYVVDYGQTSNTNQYDNSSYTDEYTRSEDGIMTDGNGTTLEDDIVYRNYDLDFETLESMVIFYSQVFEIKYDLSYDIVSNLINEDPFGFQYQFMLNGNTYNSYEEAISKVMCDISYNPENYGYTEEDVRSDTGYLLDYFYPEELIYKFSNVLDVNPNLALSIAYCECGRDLNSSNFRNNHNAGGIVGSNGYVRYRNEATGLYKFVELLHDNYGVTMESGSEKIRSMAPYYCELPEHWISLVGSSFYELNTYGYDYIFNNNSYEDRDLILCSSEEEYSYQYTRN